LASLILRQNWRRFSWSAGSLKTAVDNLSDSFFDCEVARFESSFG
jgi:hypothetical protein